MNSTISSSTRILLSDQDVDELLGRVGENEYLIETYFTNANEASDFQTAYENAKHPQNGQTITYTSLFFNTRGSLVIYTLTSFFIFY
ncbi:hypothetical protein [Bacillus sp. FJAT-29814]|uniref:hypothetical protein n=1 Tax=Bacillus sp. FJAT-29814 TaxID=1729688 RepID=UPI000B06D502|nr:hypothetical protein [Bacillus sp. FJAT-29814]